MRMIVMAASAAICASAFGGGKAYLSVKVVDSESGDPIQGILVHGGFRNYARGWNISAKDNNDDRKTDSNGMCRLSGETEAGSSCCIAWSNAGYYDSGWYSYDYTERSYLRFGRWMPDNVVVTVRLDRIVKPIPLYVRKNVGAFRRRKRGDYIIDTTYKGLSAAWGLTNRIQNVNNVTMSYDMVKGDWLPPIGGGNVADFIFRFNEEVLGWMKAEGHGVSLYKMYKMNALVVLPGEGNGLVEFRPDQNAGIKLRTAPAEGYAHSVSRWFGWFGGGDGDKTDCDGDRCYAFRIRTVYDESGKIKSAYYGKIYGDFDLNGCDGVSFLYYLNPTPLDRNLEWDRKNNLCPKPGDIGVPRP